MDKSGDDFFFCCDKIYHVGNGIENCNVDWMMIWTKVEFFFFFFFFVAIKYIGIVNC